MLLRYCLKIPLGIGDTDDLVAQRVRAVARAMDVEPFLAGIPALETGGFRQVKEDEAGRVSAALLLPPDRLARVVTYASRHPDVFVVPDPPLAAFDTWPVAYGGVFGDRTQAHLLARADKLPDSARGKGVNVAIIDHGLDRTALGASFGGGWWRYRCVDAGAVQWIEPGAGGSKHAQMIARNVLAIAPEATIWDVPLLPDTDLGPPAVSMAEAMFYYLRRDIGFGMRCPPCLRSCRGEHGDAKALIPPAAQQVLELPPGPWVLVNAWGVLDPSTYDPDECYIGNPDHKFVADMARFAALPPPRTADLVFAAGNCGEPAPLPRCSANWTGPGRSILGVNAHPDVLTVGAVRVDGVPIGLSAQGPGRLARNWPANDEARRTRAMHKPDLCAPSGFHEDDDSALLNTGTSAAAAVAAGVVAALRSYELATNGQPITSSPEMRDILRQSAGRENGQDWDPRLGYGVIDCQRALAELERRKAQRGSA
jgi:subtilisin family serine protease